MKTRKNIRQWMLSCSALCGASLLPIVAFAQVPAPPSESPRDDGDSKIESGEHIVVTDPDSKGKDSPTTTSRMAPPPGSDERADMRMMQNPRFMVDTLSEEKTEINTLKAQAAAFYKMGGSKNTRIANLLTKMRKEHEAASPKMIALTKAVGGDPNSARIMKPPVLGSAGQMLHATHMDHDKAVKTSQMRWKMSNNAKVRAAMSKRAALARKHMRWMKPYHNMKNCPMCAQMMGGMKKTSTKTMKDGMNRNNAGMATM